jgi:rare lipoprotein A
MSFTRTAQVFSNASASLLVLTVLAGCGLLTRSTPAPTTTAQSTQPSSPPSMPARTGGGYYQDDGPPEGTLPDLTSISDAAVRDEPLHRFANRPYVVFGKTYVPNVAPDRYRERGTASWYGKKFHGQATSSGETYDMMGMTAAHKTLPIPSYVRVTNPANGKSVIVRVNDRGPFHGERLIDLSYVAAGKLGIAQAGSGTVDIERVFPGDIVASSSGVPENSNAVVTPIAIAQPVPTPIPVTANSAGSTANPRPATSVTPQPVTLPATPEKPNADGFFVQLGAFASADNATTFTNRAVVELANVLPNIANQPPKIAHREGLYRVRLGPYDTQEQARAVANKVSSTLGPATVVKSQ